MFKKHFNNKLQLQITNTEYFSGERLKPTTRLILLILVNHLNCDTGLLCPSFKRLAGCTGCNEKQVSRAMEELEQKDIINVIPPEASGKRFNQYVFTEKFLHCLFDSATLSKWMQTTVKMTVKHEEHVFNMENLKNSGEFASINSIRNESKLPKYYHNTHITGPNYPKYEQQKLPCDPMPENFAEMAGLKNKRKKLCG